MKTHKKNIKKRCCKYNGGSRIKYTNDLRQLDDLVSYIRITNDEYKMLENYKPSSGTFAPAKYFKKLDGFFHSGYTLKEEYYPIDNRDTDRIDITTDIVTILNEYKEYKKSTEYKNLKKSNDYKQLKRNIKKGIRTKNNKNNLKVKLYYNLSNSDSDDE